MVSTRHHPRQFPEPASPNTRSTPSKSAKSSRPSSPTSASSTTGSVKESVTESVTNAVNAVTRTAKSPTRVTRKRRTRSTSSPLYSHLVDRWLVIWLYISIPLVLWDVGYVFFRPYTMPGGWLHSPFYTPYGFYGTVDYMYGWPAYNDGVGFTAAQSALNVLEWIMYVYYVFVVASQDVGTGWWKFWEKSFWTENAVVQGEGLALATLVCFSGAVMTFSKTALYWFNEYFSKFENIGHNNLANLTMWILLNGAWLVFPAYIMFALGREILGAMHIAGRSGLEKQD